MTWANLTSTGDGKIVGFRLMIEGWPEEFVSNTAITHSGNADGRTVYAGLLSDGLRTRERMDIRTGLPEADGITFKVVSTDNNDEAMASFTTEATESALLNASINESTVALSCSIALSATTVYHIGTEAVKTGAVATTAPSITRTLWDTQPQTHNIAVARRNFTVPIYSRPPTMEGRRATLYVYGQGDTLTGDGTVLYRGVVSHPPELASDGVTWQISTQSITSLLRHKIGSGELTTRLAGNVQYTQGCAFWTRVKYQGAESATHKILGVYTTQEMQSKVQDALDNALASVTATNVLTANFVAGDETTPHHVAIKTNTTAPTGLEFFMGSPIDGAVSEVAIWRRSDSIAGLISDILAADEHYVAYFGYDIWFGDDSEDMVSELTFRRAPLGKPNLQMKYDQWTSSAGNPTSYEPYKTGAADTGANQVLPTGTALADFPVWRLFVQDDLGSISAVHISGTRMADGMYKVDAVGSVATVNAHYVDISPRTTTGLGLKIAGFNVPLGSSFMGFLDEHTVITPIREYGDGVDVADFMNEVVLQSKDANDGETPFLTLWDVVTSGGGAAALDVEKYPAPFLTKNRSYRFMSSKGLDEILEHELPLVQHMMYLDSNEKLAMKAIPVFGSNHPVDTAHTIDNTSVLTPEGSRGAWVSWQPQAEGLVNAIQFQWDYNSGEDSHESETLEFRDATSIATHKTRGKGAMSVTPFSNPTMALTYEQLEQSFQEVAENVFSWQGRDYALVMVKVPFKHHAVRLGDIVALSDTRVPAGDGTRGVTGRRGMVIGRSWNYDTSDDEMGELTIMLLNNIKSGYTASGRITSQAGATTAWTVTLDSSNADNIAWSTTGDGKVAQHFLTGDYIRIEKVGESNDASTISGTVDSDGTTTADTVAVTLDSTWTPGAFTWVIEWDISAAGTKQTDHQKDFVYVSGSDKVLPWGGSARRFE